MMPVNFTTRWLPSGKPIVTMTITGMPKATLEVRERDLIDLSNRVDRVLRDIRERN